MNKRTVGFAALILAGIVVVQFTMIASMRSQLGAVRAQLDRITGAPAPEEAARDDANRPVLTPVHDSGDLRARLARLEQNMSDLVQATETLRQRGALPLSAENLQEFKNRFADPTASENDRMRALRMLRRNRAVTDDVLLSAVDFLRTSTNANTRRELVQNLDSSTNAVLKQPLMSLLATESSPRVREEIVDALSDFARNDPTVSSKLWELALNDPDREVREEALEEVARGELNQTQLSTLRQQALNAEASIDDRLMAFRALRQSDADISDLSAQMVEMAQAAEDPVVRARIFGAFDGVADESLKAPLVYGLQDPNPVVREQAADALAQFARTDPQIREWLTYVSQNDADPAVQREATQALQQDRGRRGRWGSR